MYKHEKRSCKARKATSRRKISAKHKKNEYKKRVISSCGDDDNGYEMYKHEKRSCKVCKAAGRRKIRRKMNTKRAISSCGEDENAGSMPKRSCKACKASGRKISTKQRENEYKTGHFKLRRGRKRAISICGEDENGRPMSKRSCKVCKATGRRKISTKQRKN